MDGKRRTPVSPAVAAGEGRSILPAKESPFDRRVRGNCIGEKAVVYKECSLPIHLWEGRNTRLQRVNN
jgi:hypothetical protein